MATMRYFVGMFGGRLYFRGSRTRIYRSIVANGSFSGNSAVLPARPVIEIDHDVYERLVDLKKARGAEAWENRNRADFSGYDNPPRWWMNSPADSWIAVDLSADQMSRYALRVQAEPQAGEIRKQEILLEIAISSGYSQ